MREWVYYVAMLSVYVVLAVLVGMAMSGVWWPW